MSDSLLQSKKFLLTISLMLELDAFIQCHTVDWSTAPWNKLPTSVKLVISKLCASGLAYLRCNVCIDVDGEKSRRFVYFAGGPFNKFISDRISSDAVIYSGLTDDDGVVQVVCETTVVPFEVCLSERGLEIKDIADVDERLELINRAIAAGPVSAFINREIGIPQPEYNEAVTIEHAQDANAANHQTNKMSRTEARDRLIRLMNQGQPYTSQKELAERVGCSESTVHKAVTTDEGLKQWRKTKDKKAAPPAVDLSDWELDRIRQDTEVDPSNQLSDEDVDRLIGEVIDISAPGERKKLEQLDGNGRRKMAQLYQDQELARREYPQRKHA